MTEVFQLEPLYVVAAVPIGVGVATYPIVLGLLNDTITDEQPTVATTFVQGAASLDTVTFDIDGTDVWVATADVNGDVQLDLPINELSADVHTLTATTASMGSSSVSFSVTTGAGGTLDPGIDAAPVLVGGANGRWVLQDLMPGGIGSWVMPINPTAMTNPHVQKNVAVVSTTAPRVGQFHVSESALPVVEWSVTGYCPDQTFHEHLVEYAELNRRLYVIDHRGRAWKCAFVGLEITPRKRQIENDGTPQDWASDYRMLFHVLDQAFLIPA